MRIETDPIKALSFLKNSQRIFIQGGAATPLKLISAMMNVVQEKKLRNLEIIHLHTEGNCPYAREEYQEIFKVSNLFVGQNMRPYMHLPHVDYIPCFLSEIPNLFRSRKKIVDVAFIHVSPPDKHGYCSLGLSVDVLISVLEVSQFVVAQINPQMPRVHGDGIIHIKNIHHAIYVDEAIPECNLGNPDEIEKQIGRHVSTLIEDGQTLQVGIGQIPNAVLFELKNHRHLGVHTEMWSDGLLPLIESGVIDNSQKVVHPGKIVSGFMMGTKKLYDFVDDNPAVLCKDIAYVNDPSVIARNPKVAAINSAIEVDLTGQVCADSIGAKIISGVGGQMDFIRGASLSRGGKPIIALTSRSKKGIGRIVPYLQQGAGVVTTRSHVHYVVTEYGIADLYGKNLKERAKALIAIAHPSDREKLENLNHHR